MELLNYYTTTIKTASDSYFHYSFCKIIAMYISKGNSGDSTYNKQLLLVINNIKQKYNPNNQAYEAFDKNSSINTHTYNLLLKIHQLILNHDHLLTKFINKKYGNGKSSYFYSYYLTLIEEIDIENKVKHMIDINKIDNYITILTEYLMNKLLDKNTISTNNYSNSQVSLPKSKSCLLNNFSNVKTASLSNSISKKSETPSRIISPFNSNKNIEKVHKGVAFKNKTSNTVIKVNYNNIDFDTIESNNIITDGSVDNNEDNNKEVITIDNNKNNENNHEVENLTRPCNIMNYYNSSLCNSERLSDLFSKPVKNDKNLALSPLNTGNNVLFPNNNSNTKITTTKSKFNPNTANTANKITYKTPIKSEVKSFRKIVNNNTIRKLLLNDFDIASTSTNKKIKSNLKINQNEMVMSEKNTLNTLNTFNSTYSTITDSVYNTNNFEEKYNMSSKKIGMNN